MPACEVNDEECLLLDKHWHVVDARRAAKVGNPERVIDATSGITKLELVRYCKSPAE